MYKYKCTGNKQQKCTLNYTQYSTGTHSAQQLHNTQYLLCGKSNPFDHLNM